MLLLLSAYFFQLTFSKNSFMNIIRVSINLDPDKGRRSVGPDLGANCLQRLSRDNISMLARKELKICNFECPNQITRIGKECENKINPDQTALIKNYL